MAYPAAGYDHCPMSNTALNELQRTALIHTLRSCQMLAAAPLPDLRKLAEISTLRSLAKGAYLFHEGEPSQGFYIVQKGAINVHRVSASGKEQTIHVFRAGDSFAEAGMAMATGYPADARALEPSQVLQVHKDGFLGLLQRQPELAMRLLGSMSQHLRTLVGRVEDLTLKDVETRLANWLVKRCPAPVGGRPHVIQLTMTKRMLAAELGTVSETLSRTLAKFREQKLVSVKGNQITVLSPARLAALLQRHLGE
jgi:CRP/FNR family transcriptional regulator